MASTGSVCEEKHKYIDEKLEEHGQRLSVHGGQIDDIAKGQVRTETVVERLCNQISDLVKELSSERDARNVEIAAEREARHVESKHLLWAFIGCMGTIIGALAMFLFWYIQQLPH